MTAHASEPPADQPAGPADVVVLLTEEPVQAEDAERILDLHAGEELAYRVLVPADTHRTVLADVVDHLALAHWRDAVAALREGQPKGDAARAHADLVLSETLTALRAMGRAADGVVTADDPLPALEAAVAQHSAREVVVVTRPHAVEETFNRDWASRAREMLGVPVLHTYAGTGRLG